VSLSIEADAEPVNAEIVTGSYFSVPGIRPLLGRLIDASDDDQPGAHPVVVVSRDYWQNRLGSRRDIVGLKVLVNKHPMTVIGVAAAGFHGVDWGEVPSLWVPTMMKREATPGFDWLFDRHGRWLHVFGRMKPGMTVQQTRAALEPWFKTMLQTDTTREDWRAFRTSSGAVIWRRHWTSCRRRKADRTCADVWSCRFWFSSRRPRSSSSWRASTLQTCIWRAALPVESKPRCNSHSAHHGRVSPASRWCKASSSRPPARWSGSLLRRLWFVPFFRFYRALPRWT
jgi:hypothetical protein